MLRGGEDQAADAMDGELAAYSEGALLQVAGVAATKGFETVDTKSFVSSTVANLKST